MRVALSLLVLVVIIGGVFMASAQDEDIDVCTDDITVRMADALDAASAQIRAGGEDLQGALVQAQLVLESYRSRCEIGLAFTHENTGAGVSDPIQMTDGTYIVRIVSDQSLTLDITELAGDCGDTYMFVPSDGGEAETVSQMEGCIMLMDIDAGTISSDVEPEWYIEFAPVVLVGE